VQTPNIDQLARESTLFSGCFTASFPTGPMRKDLHSGRYTFPYMSWRDEWNPEHEVMAELFRRDNYATSMVSDTPANGPFSRGFDHFEMIPGQVGLPGEVDTSGELDLPADVRKLRVPISRFYKMNQVRSGWKGEEDRFAARTMRSSAVWMESIHGKDQPFLLVSDTFDPHEPWDSPRYYIDRYDPGYEGDELFEPAYEPSDYASDEEIRHMRCMYAGEVSMVDRWVGYLLDTLDQMGLAEETVVILTSDHGFYHGEHGLIGKVELDREGRITRRWPLYRTIGQIPLIIRVPGSDPGVADGFCQPPDFLPTMLELAGLTIPAHVQGRSLVSELGGGGEGADFAISSLTYRQDEDVRSPTSFRTENSLYIYGGDEWQSEFYDLQQDPDEQQNVIVERESEARDCHEKMLKTLEKIGCPPSILEMRREFDPGLREKLPIDRIL
jgi:arylsulfatase A-like enzyme